VPGSVSKSRGTLGGKRGNRRGRKAETSVCACGLRKSGCGSNVFIRTSMLRQNADLPVLTGALDFAQRRA
jgi:hypothetical protein